jgi:DNA-binding CsgD family transcriptional regulator
MAKPAGEAQAAFDRGEWGNAYRGLAQVAAGGELSVDDLDRLATAAYLIGRDEEAFTHWARAHHDTAAAGDVIRAVRFGARLASVIGFKGDIGRASGWAERTRRFVDDAQLDCVETGYLDHAAATCRVFETGDVAGAAAMFARARKTGQRFRDRELVALAQIGEGRCLIYLGDVAEGVALLDEGIVAVEAGDVSPINTGDAYCTVIDGCHELFDLRRCHAWATSFTRWCDAQPDLVLYRGQCLLHRADVMLLRGEWTIGADEAIEACRRLAEPVNLLTLGRAHYLAGDYHRLRGAFDEAEAAYETANEYGCEPQPGLSLLRLAQGDHRTADASIRRQLAEAPGPVARARVLDAYIQIVLAGYDLTAAGAAAEDLAGVAASLGSDFLRAQASRANGAIHLAAGEPAQALVALRGARRGWSELEAPYDAARTRVLIAAACRALGDSDGEALELRAARVAFANLGAAPDLAELDAPPPRATERELPGGLTNREAEILSLVAAGMTNRAIANDLAVSEKTVASHISHILTKLNVPSRASATAYAYNHGLIGPSGRRTSS